ncbi:LptF/LptG family permease [Brachyspira sp.]|uniref:LptF/LptG family permease n=1 Tax=Brachyspira sp. TaxID=1977261 RepID=UPI00262EDB09|nr:LptF/LptG family permease [Brachyspira sp.]
MKKLSIYLLKEFLSFFFGSLFLFVVLVTIADLSSRLSFYTEHPELINYFITYHLARAPHNTYYIFPVALMFSSTYVLGNFVKNKEMLAVENSGISLFKFSMPIFTIVIVLCLLLVFFWEFVAAPLNKVSFEANDAMRGNQKASKSGPWQIFGGNNYLYFIETYFYKEQYMTNTIILKINDDGGIKFRISSPYIQWSTNDRKWYVQNGILTTFTDNKEIDVKEINNYPLDVLERPEHFYGRPPLDSMSISEEANIIKLQKEVNMNTSRLETDMHYRISYCFSGFIIVLLASLFSKFSTQSVLVISLVMVIIVALLYYSIVMIFRSMGEAGNFNPFIAAWMPNIIFSLLCILAFKKFY